MCFIGCFFFFKQKTAYEMRISDWMSDVCSSDLLPGELCAFRFAEHGFKRFGNFVQGILRGPDFVFFLRRAHVLRTRFQGGFEHLVSIAVLCGIGNESEPVEGMRDGTRRSQISAVL